MDIKNEIKQLFSDMKKTMEDAGILKAEKFADWKLQDGTTIVRTDTDTLDKGSKITVISDSGEIPLVDGEYTVMVNDAPVTITVQGGYVTDVAQGADDATAGDAAAPAGEDMATVSPTGGESNPHHEVVPQLVTKMAEFETRLAAVEANCMPKSAMDEMQNKFNSIESENKNLKDVMTKMFELVKKIGEEPVVAPVSRNTHMKAHKKVETVDVNDLQAKIERLQKLNKQ